LLYAFYVACVGLLGVRFAMINTEQRLTCRHSSLDRPQRREPRNRKPPIRPQAMHKPSFRKRPYRSTVCDANHRRKSIPL